jgi:hypothetical protein
MMSATTFFDQEAAATTTRSEIPCEVCGYPRTLLAGLQWCGNCGWNRQAALSGLRIRSRFMIGIAVCIVIGEALLLQAIPKMGVIYLPLVGFLAAAVAIFPYREYRRVQQTATQANNRPSPEIVAIRLRSLRPQLRIFALLLLGLASATDIALLFVPGPSVDRILPMSIVLFAILFFGGQLLVERRIVANYASALARIVRFQRRGRGGRIAIYEYESPLGISITGKGVCSGFSVGMTVPVLYNASKPDESRPVTDFIFYRIRSELP